VNEVKIEGTNADEADNRIEEQLGRMFEDRTEWDFDGRGVSFDSTAGVVTITGTVESQAIKDRIGQRARQVAGVRDVVNNLEVKAADANRRPANERRPADRPGDGR
jgi:osmotically-inducible protein OsmY